MGYRDGTDARSVVARLFGIIAPGFLYLLVLGFVLAFSSATMAQSVSYSPTWTQLSPASSPPTRSEAAMTYDASRGQVVLFGGLNGIAGYLGDTWIWNGTSWTQPSLAVSPGVRFAANMAYDAATGQVLLFSGSSSSSFQPDDTWAWNGTAWTQLSPATSPIARSGASVAYDAASGQLILFGGFNAYNGYYLNDTWAWNGTTWTQLSPGTSPPGRTQGAMAYDAATGQLVLFGGSNGSSALGDTWTWNGTTWMQQSPAAGPGARSGAAMAYDNATGQVVLYSGLNSSYLSDTWTWNGVTWTQQSPVSSPTGEYASTMAYDTASYQLVLFGGSNSSSLGTSADTFVYQASPVNLGTANVCPSGSSSPAPCSQSQTLYFTNGAIAVSGVVVNVLTQGAIGQDFTEVSDTCSGSLAANATCAVTVKFAPQLPGSRYGAVTLTTAAAVSAANPLGTLGDALVVGTGNAPLAVYPGNAATTVLLGSGLNSPSGVAVDGSGNVYIADSLNSVIRELPAGCTSVACLLTLGGGFSYPYGVAVDGAGNIFVADTNNGAIKVMPPGCSSASCVSTVSTGFNSPYGVAVDAADNVYVADTNNYLVREIPAGCTSIACVFTIGGGFSLPAGVAVDGTGNVYVADQGHSAVKEISAGCLSAACVSVLGGGFGPIGSVAVDGSGNVYTADSSADAVKEIPAGCVAASCVLSLSTQFVNPSHVAVDGKGNVFVTDITNSSGTVAENAVREFSMLSAATTVTFPTATGQYTTDTTDGTMTALAWNNGNAPLSFRGFGYPADFIAGSGVTGACSTSATVAAASSCYVTAEFSPGGTASGTVTEAVTVMDNSLNAASAQSVNVSGTSTPSYELTIAANNSAWGTVSPATGSHYAPGTVVSLTATPSPGYYFVNWTGSPEIYLPNNASAATTMTSAENLTANFAPIPGFIVTTASDDATGVAANCPANNSPASSNCTLRDALAAAATVQYPNGQIPVTFSSTVWNTTNYIVLGSGGTLTVPSNTSITGPTYVTTNPFDQYVGINGGNTYQIFTVPSGESNVSINGLQLFNGYSASSDGGAITAASPLTVTGSYICSNSAYSGGGIYSSANLTVTNSTLCYNSATNYPGGGAIAVGNGASLTLTGDQFLNNTSGQSGGAVSALGPLTVTNSYFSANTAGSGGAISVTGTANITGSTFDSNTSARDGGAVIAQSDVTLVNDTFHANASTAGSGGALRTSGTLTVTSSTFSNNTVTSPNSGAVYGQASVVRNSIFVNNTGGYINGLIMLSGSSDHNLFYGGDVCQNCTTNTNAVSGDPKLGTLAANGGTEPTMVPQPGSAAICAGSAESGVTTDERGISISGARYGQSGCYDIGAVQTEYAMGFLVQPSDVNASQGMSPSPSLSMTENGNGVSSVPITLTDAANDLSVTPQTWYFTAGVGSLGSPVFTSAATGDTLTAAVTLSPTVTLTATSNSFNVTVVHAVLTIAANNSAWGTFTPASGNSYALGTVVQLTATPNPGYYFVNWTGSPEIYLPNSPSAATTMTSAQSLTANFAPIPGFVVTTKNDDATGVAANCPANNSPASSNCTLRDALAAAAAIQNVNGTIPITFSSTVWNTTNYIVLGSGGTLTVPSNTSITGPTFVTTNPISQYVGINGNNLYPIFSVPSGETNVSINGLLLFSGNGGSSGGGAITAASPLTLSGSYLVSNSAYEGGAVFATANLTVTNSTLGYNTATSSFGGAVYTTSNATLTLTNDLVENNTAVGSGGGIGAAGSMTVTNSVFTQNTTPAGAGGAIAGYGTLTVTNSTFSGNTAAANAGGAIAASGGIVRNSIFMGNTAASAPGISMGGGTSDHNLFYGGDGCAGCTINTNAVSGDPKLSFLEGFGGLTQSLMPQPGSAAICAGAAEAGVTTDMRGYAISGTRYGQSSCYDIGAMQTNYAISFAVQPSNSYVAVAMSPAPVVSVTESGSAFVATGVVVKLTDAQAALTVTPQTLTTSIVTGTAGFNTVSFGSAEATDTLTANFAVTSSINATATSNSFAVSPVLTATTAVASTTLTLNVAAGQFTPVTANGGLAALSFAVAPALPAGLTMSAATGAISGTPTAPSGATTYTVTVTDANSTTATATFSLRVIGLGSLVVSHFPSPAIVSEAGSVTVTVLDTGGSTYTGFTGVVTLTSTDATATLPGSYTFTAGDAGVHTFVVTLATRGTQSITATSGSVSGVQSGILAGDAIWVLNATGTLVKLDESGTAVLEGIGTIASPATHGGVAFDAGGNVWSVSSSSNSVSVASSLGNGAATYSGGGLNAPVSVAIDGSGQAWIANSGNNSVSVFSNAGIPISGSSGVVTTSLSSPSAIAVDATGGVWVANQGSNTITHVFGAAGPLSTPLAAGVANGTTGGKP